MSHDVYLICTGFERGDEYPLSQNVHLDFIPDASGSRLHLMFVRIRYIREKIAEIKPDCIVSLADARTSFMITAANLGSPVPMIFSERHDPVHNPKSKAERLLRLICYRACDRVVFQTEGAKSFFSPAISRKGTIIPNPIKEALPAVWRGERKPVIATFCRLNPQKNLSMLLHAFHKLTDEYPDLRLAIYGDGESKPALEREAEQLGILSRTEFHPHSLDVHSLVKDCAMFVSSSDYEGQSNSMLEAMAMGLPCVCTDCPCGGARAVIDNGVNGLLVPAGDEQALSAAILRLLRDPETAERLGNAARKTAESFRPEAVFALWRDYAEEIINSGRNG